MYKYLNLTDFLNKNKLYFCQKTRLFIFRHGVDTDGWGPGPDDCEQTLLHRLSFCTAKRSFCALSRSFCTAKRSFCASSR